MIRENTEMITKCHDLINEIDARFEPFIEIYLNYHKQDITYEEMENKMRDTIRDMDDSTMEEYNEMHKMYSHSNCGWDSFETGEIVHKLLIEKWYPERKLL